MKPVAPLRAAMPGKAAISLSVFLDYEPEAGRDEAVDPDLKVRTFTVPPAKLRRKVVAPGREVDEPVKGPVAHVEVKRCHSMALPAELSGEAFEVLALKEHARPVIHGRPGRIDVELGCVHSQPARHQGVERSLNEAQALADRT